MGMNRFYQATKRKLFSLPFTIIITASLSSTPHLFMANHTAQADEKPISP